MVNGPLSEARLSWPPSIVRASGTGQARRGLPCVPRSGMVPRAASAAAESAWSRPTMRRLLKILVALCLLLVLAAAGLMWRLSRGPVSLAPLQGMIETLIDRGTPYLVTLSDPSLVWLPQQHSVAL